MNYRPLIAALFTLAACNSPARQFTVHGSISDSLATAPGSMVYLIGADGPIDSTTVGSDGTFTFTGKAEDAQQLVVMLQFDGRDEYDDRFIAGFVPDVENIDINLDYPVIVTGSPLTDAIKTLRNRVNTLFYEHETDIGSAAMGGNMDVADSMHRARMKKIEDHCRKVFLDNRKNALGLQALGYIASDLEYEDLQNLYDKAGENIRSNETISAILEGKKNAAQTTEGSGFIDFTGEKADGTPVALSDFVGKGSFVLADFWASWCGPCMHAVDMVRALRKEYAEKGLVVLGVNVWDRPEEARNCAVEQKMEWDLIFTAEDSVTKLYGIEAIPTFILFAPDGSIAARLLGHDGLEEMIAEHLGE